MNRIYEFDATTFVGCQTSVFRDLHDNKLREQSGLFEVLRVAPQRLKDGDKLQPPSHLTH